VKLSSIPHFKFAALIAPLALLVLLCSPLLANPSYLLMGSTWEQQPTESLCVINTTTGLATPFTTTGDRLLMGIA
jgi:hypothetical protein